MSHPHTDILSYPRYLIRSDIALGGCCHNRLFDSTSRECLECVDSADCRWLNDIEHLQETAQAGCLLRALDYAIKSVSTQTVRLEHDPSICTCDTCSWLRKARAMLNTAESAVINTSG